MLCDPKELFQLTQKCLTVRNPCMWLNKEDPAHGLASELKYIAKKTKYSFDLSGAEQDLAHKTIEFLMIACSRDSNLGDCYPQISLVFTGREVEYRTCAEKKRIISDIHVASELEAWLTNMNSLWMFIDLEKALVETQIAVAKAAGKLEFAEISTSLNHRQMGTIMMLEDLTETMKLVSERLARVRSTH